MNLIDETPFNCAFRLSLMCNQTRIMASIFGSHALRGNLSRSVRRSPFEKEFLEIAPEPRMPPAVVDVARFWYDHIQFVKQNLIPPKNPSPHQRDALPRGIGSMAYRKGSNPRFRHNTVLRTFGRTRSLDTSGTAGSDVLITAGERVER
jgi:hypothetical protein